MVVVWLACELLKPGCEVKRVTRFCAIVAGSGGDGCTGTVAASKAVVTISLETIVIK
jgi:hypothetical protein